MDKRFLKNWWPVSLINVDAEKASKAIALRIKKVIRKLSPFDQTANVCNRNIGESVCPCQPFILLILVVVELPLCVIVSLS